MDAVELGLLPPPVFSPELEDVGGFIFVVDQIFLQETFRRMIFDSVKLITPGLPLFIFGADTGYLHGVYQAASYGGFNIDPLFWPDSNNPGTSLYPAQVRFNFTDQHLFPPLRHYIFTRIATYNAFVVLRPALTTPQTQLLMELLDIHRRITMSIARHRACNIGCPVLESLSIEFPMNLRNASIIGQTRLKHLDLSFVWELHSLEIHNVTSLVSMRLYELGNGCNVQFGNIPKHSDLEFGEGRSRLQHASLFVAMPFYLRNQLRSLRLSTINGDACRGDIGPFVKFVNVKNMELVIQMQQPVYSYYYRHCLYRLIAACTSLEKLFSWRLADDLELMKEDSRRSPVRMNEVIYATCLKELEIEEYLGSRSESRLCSDVIGHAKALKKLIVVPCGLNDTVREASLARAS